MKKSSVCFAGVPATLSGCITITQSTYWAPSGTGKVTSVGDGVPSIMKFSLTEKAVVSVDVTPATEPTLHVNIDLGKQGFARLDSDKIELVCGELPPRYLTIDVIRAPPVDYRLPGSAIPANSDMPRAGAALYWISMPLRCEASSFQVTLPGVTFATAHLSAQTVRFAVRSGRFASMPGTVM